MSAWVRSCSNATQIGLKNSPTAMPTRVRIVANPTATEAGDHRPRERPGTATATVIRRGAFGPAPTTSRSRGRPEPRHVQEQGFVAPAQDVVCGRVHLVGQRLA